MAVSRLIVRDRTLYLQPCVLLCSVGSDGSLRLSHAQVATSWRCLLARLLETRVCVTDSAIRVAYRDSEVSTRSVADLSLFVSVSCAKMVPPACYFSRGGHSKTCVYSDQQYTNDKGILNNA